MRLISTYLSLLLLLPSLLFPLTLKERFTLAKEGDYLVTLHDRTYTLFHIVETTNKTLVIEELSISQSEWKKQHTDWKTWLQKGAKGNQSWVMYEIDLKTASITEYYSFTRKGWLEVTPQENFLPLLLNLNFEKVADQDRRKIGGNPSSGGIDRRKNWEPPVYYEGKKVPYIKHEVWKSRWAKDDTPLSNKEIQIYLPLPDQNIPAYYPFWLQLSNDIAKAHIRVVDSGKGLKAPIETLPRRPAHFTDPPEYKKGELTLPFKVFSSVDTFTLYAYSSEPGFDTPIELKTTFQQTSPNLWSAHVTKQELKKKLVQGSFYTFALRLEGDSEQLIETNTPFNWNPLGFSGK